MEVISEVGEAGRIGKSEIGTTSHSITNKVLVRGVNTMSKQKTHYCLTVGYKAVLSINVKADSIEEAKKLGLEEMKKVQKRISNNKTDLQDDNFKIDGVVDMDASWNILG